MSTFMELRKDELVKAAEFYKVEIDVDATKAGISAALLDAGVTPEQWEADAEAHDSGEAPRQTVTTSSIQEEGADKPVEQEPKKEEPKKSDAEGDMVLVRFTGKNHSYVTGNHRFGLNRPFGLVTKDEFDALDTNKFREATKAEAAEFYGG